MSSEDKREPVFSENEFGQKWDKCISDTVVKMGGGIAVGVAFSLLLFKRKSWPVVFGLGTGLGMGYANCQNDFNSPFKAAAQRCRIKMQPQQQQQSTEKK